MNGLERLLHPRNLIDEMRRQRQKINLISQRDVNADTLEEINNDLGDQRGGTLTSSSSGGDVEDGDFSGWGILLDPLSDGDEEYSGIGKNNGETISGLSHKTGHLLTVGEDGGSIGSMGGNGPAIPPNQLINCENDIDSDPNGPTGLTTDISLIDTDTPLATAIFPCAVRRTGVHYPTNIVITCAPVCTVDGNQIPDDSNSAVIVRALNDSGTPILNAATSSILSGDTAQITAEFSPVDGLNVGGFSFSIPINNENSGIYAIPIGVVSEGTLGVADPYGMYIQEGYGPPVTIPAVGDPEDVFVGYLITLSIDAHYIGGNPNFELHPFGPQLPNSAHTFQHPDTMGPFYWLINRINAAPAPFINVCENFIPPWTRQYDYFGVGELKPGDTYIPFYRQDCKNACTYSISYDYAIFYSPKSLRSVSLGSIQINNICPHD